MKLYVPYASAPLVDAVLQEIADEIKVKVEFDISPNKPKIRKSALDVKGIPHVEVTGLKLRARKGNDVYRKFSGERRTVGICWHGHKMFMERLFRALDNATLLTALAKYYGKQSFDELHYATQHTPWNGREWCGCWTHTINDEGLSVYLSDQS